MNASKRPVLFLLFFVSGFCGLVYQVVWTRMAYASFGIITPVLSVVISVFMLGLAAGSWAGGRGVECWCRNLRLSPIALYATAEAIIMDPVMPIKKVLESERSVEQILSQGPNTRITDDEPYNEYFLLRYLGLF